MKSLLVVGIYWVGFQLTPSADMVLIKENKMIYDENGFTPQYELTCRGEPICINEYATEIGNAGSHTHVIQLDDYQAEPINIGEYGFELNTTLINEKELTERTSGHTTHTFI